MNTTTMIIPGHNNVRVWVGDDPGRIRRTFYGGRTWAEPFVGDTSLFVSTAVVDIPARYEDGVAEVEAVIVPLQITDNRVKFVAPCDLTFGDLQALAYAFAGWTPDHAHIMPADRKRGGPDHVWFWAWEGQKISHFYPSWETGEAAKWEDLAASEGDMVSLDCS